MNYGTTLKRLREAAQLAQARVADAMGVSASYLSLIESGQRPISTPEFLRAQAALHELVAERDATWQDALQKVSS